MELRFAEIESHLEGLFYYKQESILRMYATDASAYQEMPLAVALPANTNDIQVLIRFASENGISIIPRAAGTSLAGQVVGKGLVVDISKNLNQILEVNTNEKWVKVQPGVIRNDLNAYLKPYGLMFGPETSTASRAMIGGMIGNNSSGLHSIVWGDTRQNILELEVVLSDGSIAILNEKTLSQKHEGLLDEIVNNLNALLQNFENQEHIRLGFPHPNITRRNTGYALDMLLHTQNICQLIAGSEGTLCFILSAKLKLMDLPSPHVALVCVHCETMRESLEANLIALENGCFASELIDDVILAFKDSNPTQKLNGEWVVGSPKAILMVEFYDNDDLALENRIQSFTEGLKAKNYGYAYPVLYGTDSHKAWELRKAALSLLSNQKGDLVPTNFIEDCAVHPQDLPDYIDEIEALLQENKLEYSISAHASAGELHVNPLMNLKSKEGQEQFRTILDKTAQIVKKYKGSLSGEHGDGRLRGEFIPFMMGEYTYELFKEVKRIFDPKTVFNKGKITDSPPMNTFLRVQETVVYPTPPTVFDFSEDEGILRLAEKCSGSGDCRKTHITGGTMCPSYMATRHEKDTTRARANLLRQYYSEPGTGLQNATKEVLDLCLSCKACKSECPSGVDIGKMKAEFTQSYYEANGVPLRSKLIAHFDKLMRFSSYFPRIYNFLYSHKSIQKRLNFWVGFHPDRSIPLLEKETFQQWFSKRKISISSTRKVAIFVDEFSNYNDVSTAKNLVLLLEKLGYEVRLAPISVSGRTYLSKGFVKEAQKLANQNTQFLAQTPWNTLDIVGIEPSALLTFRDENIDLVKPELKDNAREIASRSYLFEEWFTKEMEAGNIKKEQFSETPKKIKLHAHCHQKALTSLIPSKKALSFPKNYTVELIPSGCCGMAGSFGYEKEHFELSQQVAELVLFPTIRSLEKDIIVAATGTSCRHQIKDGLQKESYHPIDILFEALL
ncbi:MAG: FAD-binding and (Fe-S)-binding domain-containing protein [Leadbetterella sp.]